MKKIGIICSLIIFSTAIFAQEKSTELHVGFLIPKGAKTGFIGGINLGKSIDENISWGIEIDCYKKSYTKETNIADSVAGDAIVRTRLTEIENSVIMLPVYFKVIFNTPVNPKYLIRVSGGVGYEVLWNKMNNYLIRIKETKFYRGFTWQLGVGISTQLSRATDAFLDVVYHNGAPSRSEDIPDIGLPVKQEISMSGVIFRIGIRIYSLGI
jgi:hypothetical protein